MGGNTNVGRSDVLFEGVYNYNNNTNTKSRLDVNVEGWW